MNIQIFGKAKCFDTKKAERYFKERRIKYQYIDIIKYGMSRGELKSVCSSLGMEAVVNKALVCGMTNDEIRDMLELLLED